MTVVAVVARVLLAAVFAAAGTAKLADRAGIRRAVEEFGTPMRFAAPVALLLPLVELAVAGLLLPSTTAGAAVVAALALLAVFTAAVAVSLLRGRAPDCHCFGQLHSAPASWKTLVRNAGLAAVGVIALLGSITEPRASATAWIGDLEPAALGALVGGGVAAALLGVGLVAFVTVMRSYGHLLVRLDRLEAALTEAGIDVGARETAPRLGLDPGTASPWFLGTTPSGAGLSRDDLLAPGLPLLLLFTSPNCAPCAALLPDAARWQVEYADVLTIAFASEGSAEAVAAEAAEFELERVLVDEQGAIAASYSAGGTPSAVLIASDGTIASWVASGQVEIEALLDDALRPGEDDGGLAIGVEAPAVELPALDGGSVALAELRGRDTLLLFWNPSCGYCREMHEDLIAWEQTANGVTPRLVVLSSGDRESTAAEGFRSTVLLDSEFVAGSAFGAGGTPMAVLVGADGRLASGVVAGADAVLALARRRVVEHA